MEQFLSYFTFDVIGIAGLSAMLLIFIIQAFFYFFYYKKPLNQYRNMEEQPLSSNTILPSVSVVIVAKDESENLAKSLPPILNQDYPDYEVVVVNDGSTDESELLLKNLKREYSHLYSTFSPISYENESRRQKILSLTIGIKAATKDVLLFTEADSCPVSSDWIKSMMSQLTPEKDIVLGYCHYTVHKSLWGKVALFDNLLFSLQYLSKALRNKPYVGVYRNTAYRKHLFFDNKGFSSALKYDHAEKIFLNSIMTEYNTAVALSESSFVSCELESFSMWKFIKTNYMRAKSHFKNFTPRIFHLETVTRYLFYISFLAMVAYSGASFLWAYLIGSILIFAARFLIQYIVLKKSAGHFNTSYYSFLLPVMDIIQPYYNSYFMSYSRKKVRRNKK